MQNNHLILIGLVIRSCCTTHDSEKRSPKYKLYKPSNKHTLSTNSVEILPIKLVNPRYYPTS